MTLAAWSKLPLGHGSVAQQGAVAELFRVSLVLIAEALVGAFAGVIFLVGALPVGPALLALIAAVANVAHASRLEIYKI